jgi:hypothetical protein
MPNTNDRLHSSLYLPNGTVLLFPFCSANELVSGIMICWFQGAGSNTVEKALQLRPYELLTLTFGLGQFT